MGNNLDGPKLDLPPERLPSDSIQLLFLLIVFIVGVPSNLLTLRRLFKLHRRTRKDSSRATFVQLKLFLTISDLMLLFFYVAPQLLWNITYEWIFGDCMCKFYNYISMASFYFSSNVVVCIAINRLQTVLGALEVGNGLPSNRSVMLLIVPAFVLAFLWASPQLVVFQTANVLSHSNQSWIQCSDVWSISGIQQARTDLPPWFLTPLARLAYELAHLLLVFWVPLLVLLVTYGTIALRVSEVSAMHPRSRFSSMHPYITDDKGRSQSMPGEPDGARMLIKRLSLAPAQIKSRLRSYSITSSSSERGEVALQGGAQWKRRIREKLFRSTLLFVVAHFLFWFPYNISALLAHANREYSEVIALHAHFLNDLQVMITLVNPVLYAITE